MMILILAMIMAESGGDNFKIGDEREGYGCLQIHDIYIRDINEIYGTKYTRKDAFDRDKSIRMCELYLQHYATKERIGRNPTFEDMARIHNGGPRGYKKQSTLNHWREVKKYLK